MRSWAKSPLAIRCLKSAFNADCDGQAGIQELAGKCNYAILSDRGRGGRERSIPRETGTELPQVPLAAVKVE